MNLLSWGQYLAVAVIAAALAAALPAVARRRPRPMAHHARGSDPELYRPPPPEPYVAAFRCGDGCYRLVFIGGDDRDVTLAEALTYYDHDPKGRELAAQGYALAELDGDVVLYLPYVRIGPGHLARGDCDYRYTLTVGIPLTIHTGAPPWTLRTIGWFLRHEERLARRPVPKTFSDSEAA